MVVNNGRILLVDDNEDILIMMKTMLSMKGYSVDTARSREEMDKLLDSAEELPQVIFIDLHLKGCDGRIVCKDLKGDKLRSQVPLVMCTADPGAEQSCMDAGANYFLEKPFSMTNLLGILEEITSAKN